LKILYWGIVNSFTMKTNEVKDPEARAGQELARDDEGLLYSTRLRELMAPLGIDTSAMEALAALRLAGKFMHLMQDRWAEQHGLTEGRLAVMFRLYRQGDCPLGDLASELDTTPRNITGLVDHLERDGLVERIPDPQDRRSLRAKLTAAGKERIESIWREGFERQQVVTEQMSKEDLAQLRHLCLQLVENARKELGK
jgi:DNA-binding MarR family transcriptional regulator